MKILSIFVPAALVVVLSHSAFAQFDCGSNGSYGPLNVPAGTSVTLQVPPDGIFHCTTINIIDDTNVRFLRNAANTPVYLLATGDVVIGQGQSFVNGSARIHVSGSPALGIGGGTGGPGGFDGGDGGLSPGDGHGPGGGKGGWVGDGVTKPSGIEYRGNAGFATQSTQAGQLANRGDAYGNSLLLPLIGGSGGGGGQGGDSNQHFGGGGGGGAILIASNTKIVFGFSSYPGQIFSRGGRGDYMGAAYGNGSGGAVRLVAPRIEGKLEVYVNHVEGSGSGDQYSGSGRLRIDTFDNKLSSLVVAGNQLSVGSNMVIFPPSFPEVRLVQVGTEVIAPDRVDPVLLLLPPGSSTTQEVKVSVKNFKTLVPLQVVVTPDAGPKTIAALEIDNRSGGVSEGSVNVNVPVGVSSRVDVWTR